MELTSPKSRNNQEIHFRSNDDNMNNDRNDDNMNTDRNNYDNINTDR